MWANPPCSMSCWAKGGHCLQKAADHPHPDHGRADRGKIQLVFIDTPGLHKPRTRLGDYMVRSVSESVSGVDACLLVAEAGRRSAPPSGS